MLALKKFELKIQNMRAGQHKAHTIMTRTNKQTFLQGASTTLEDGKLFYLLILQDAERSAIFRSETLFYIYKPIANHCICYTKSHV